MPIASQVPPGPLNFNSALGMTWRHWVSFWWDPTGFFTRLAKRYGDLVFFRLFTHRCYLVNDPECIWKIFVTERDAFGKWSPQMRVMKGLFGDSVLTTSGETWRRQRNEVQPFFSPQSLKHAASQFAETVDETIGSWGARETGDLEPELNHLLVRMTTLGMFEYDVGDEAPQLMEAVRVISYAGNREMFDLIPIPDHWPLPSKRRKREAVRRIRKLVRSILERPSRNPAVSRLVAPRDPDGFGEVAVVDQLVTMFVAAVHTTSAWICWTVKLLAQSPEWQERVAREFHAAGEKEFEENGRGQSMDPLDQVLQESLRLHPPAWSLFARQTLRDVRVGDYMLPSGSAIFVLPHVMHRDPRYYPDPMRFDPDRFLPTEESKRPRGVYFPFGLGPHQCAGAALARLQAQAVVGSLVTKFELIPQSTESFRTLTHLAVRPRDGVRIALRNRRETATDHRTMVPSLDQFSPERSLAGEGQTIRAQPAGS